jgi:DNA-binding NtrC family response regulator
MLLDMKMPHVKAVEVLRQAKELDSNLIMIVITSYCDARDSVRAVKAGTYDYLERPFPVQEAIRMACLALTQRKEIRRTKGVGGECIHPLPYEKLALE